MQAKRFTTRRQAAYLCTHLRIQYWLESKMSSRWIQPEFQREARRENRVSGV
jgi:hypothetical protein